MIKLRGHWGGLYLNVTAFLIRKKKIWTQTQGKGHVTIKTEVGHLGPRTAKIKACHQKLGRHREGSCPQSQWEHGLEDALILDFCPPEL